MQEFDPHMRLIAIGEYLSPIEAGIFAVFLNNKGIRARVDGDELCTTLSYIGTAIGGARVLVAEEHAEQAVKLLDEWQANNEPGAEAGIAGDFDYGDRSPEEESCDQEQEEHPSHALSPREYERLLERAFRIAVIGMILAPFCIFTYSIWIIFRHQLWSRNDIGVWRFYVAMVCNICAAIIARLIWLP